MWNRKRWLAAFRRRLFGASPPERPAVPETTVPITLEPDAFLYPGSNIECPLHLGRGSRVNGPLSARGTGKVYIGRYAAIGRHVTIITSNHYIEYPNLQERLQRRIGAHSILTRGSTVILNHNCWIGDNVTILRKAEIGIGAVIGGGSVVTKPIPDFAIAVGNPARVLRYRFPEEIIAFLLECRWWEWNEEKMRRNKKFFETDLTQIESAKALRDLIR